MFYVQKQNSDFQSYTRKMQRIFLIKQNFETVLLTEIELTLPGFFYCRWQNSKYDRDLCSKWLATPLISVKMRSAYMFIFMQIKSILYERFGRRLVLKQRQKVTRK